MIIRRAFYYWMFPAAIVLPIWLLVGWGFFGSSGWTFLGLLILCPLLFVALGLIALLISVRSGVRVQRAVSWIDVAVLTFWDAMIVGFGFFGESATWFAILGIVGFLVAFWVSIWQIFRVRPRITVDEPMPKRGLNDGFDGETIIIVPSDPQGPTAS